MLPPEKERKEMIFNIAAAESSYNALIIMLFRFKLVSDGHQSTYIVLRNEYIKRLMRDE